MRCRANGEPRVWRVPIFALHLAAYSGDDAVTNLKAGERINHIVVEPILICDRERAHGAENGVELVFSEFGGKRLCHGAVTRLGLSHHHHGNFHVLDPRLTGGGFVLVLHQSGDLCLLLPGTLPRPPERHTLFHAKALILIAHAKDSDTQSPCFSVINSISR